MLQGGMLPKGGRRGRVARTALALGGGALLVVAARGRGMPRAAAALGSGALRLAPKRPRVVRRAITIGCDRATVFRVLRDPERLVGLTPGVRRIEVVDAGRRWRWHVEGPGGVPVTWDAVFDDIREDRRLAWHADEEPAQCGVVELRDAPGGRGTEVVFTLAWQAPLGRAGVAAAWAAGREPSRQVIEMLRHLKQHLEIGEIATVAGQPHGRRPRRWTVSE